MTQQKTPLADIYITGNEIAWHKNLSHLCDIQSCDTLPKILRYNALTYPDQIAQREKEFGIWNGFSWSQIETQIAHIALGLQTLGIGAGDVVLLIGDNRPEWIWGEIAAHACRAKSMGVYRDALEKEILYLLDYAKPKIVLAENEEQIDKFLSLPSPPEGLTHLVYSETRGMRKYDDPRLMSLAQLQQLGAQIIAKDPQRYHKMVNATHRDDIAILCTTSGTSSNPKLSMWTHKAFIGHAMSYLHADPKGADDTYIAVLPLSWVMEQMYSVAWNFIARMCVNFGEEQETIMEDLREIGPSFVLLAPRVWEQIAADIRARMMESSYWKQALYRWSSKIGMRAIEQGKHSQLAEWLIFRALRDRLGFKNLTSAATGGAAMGPDTYRFFLAMGIPLRQLYGQTESMGAVAIHQEGDIHSESVGFPMPGVDIRIHKPDEDGIGEIYIRHPHMMQGYYQKPQATQEVINPEGWLMTGDAGYLDAQNHLRIIDRIKDLAVTTTQHRFSPQFIENKLKFSSYIAEAVILGGARPYLSAIICIRYLIVSKWAEQHRLRFTTYTDLATRPEVIDLIAQEVQDINQTLPTSQRIQKFILLYKELDADDGELTRTRKVRRAVIHEKYADIINVLYEDKTQVDIDTVIHFQDGSRQRIQTTLKVIDLQATTDIPHPTSGGLA